MADECIGEQTSLTLLPTRKSCISVNCNETTLDVYIPLYITWAVDLTSIPSCYPKELNVTVIKCRSKLVPLA